MAQGLLDTYALPWPAPESEPTGSDGFSDKVIVFHALTFKGFLYLMLHICVFKCCTTDF